MQGCSWFNNFISGIYVDLGERSDYSLSYLSGWFLDESNLGNLNTHIDYTFYIVGYTGSSGEITGLCIEPTMDSSDKGLYKSLFDIFFYGREAKLALRDSYSSSTWNTLKEGDTSISRGDRSTISRSFTFARKDAENTFESLLKRYMRNKAKPKDIPGDDTVPGGYYRDYEGNWRNKENII